MDAHRVTGGGAGEDALANLSIEKADGVLQGHVRIRSKTQGIALSLGDKITLLQRYAFFTTLFALQHFNIGC